MTEDWREILIVNKFNKRNQFGIAAVRGERRKMK